ncbi:hypothetical protein [Streptomyces sp. NPDC097610]|uniref:hypothetical protein n=1 Tax=Streptomyces sp. NPDC097610 TaxID=3157227 RepID=UPI00331B0DF8
MVARVDEGIRKLRSRGGHYGAPNGGKPLYWVINKAQEGRGVPADRTGRHAARRPHLV